MIDLIATTAASNVLRQVITDAANPRNREKARVWGVFVPCLLCSATGAGLGLLVFGAARKGFRLWGVGFVIAVVMPGISYGARYAGPEARQQFTPVDLIQYLSRGSLWPSTWPALADVLGIEPIAPPDTSRLEALSSVAKLLA